jgi:pimeloyl-ACP methyl ester carboxylesterase
VDGAEHSVVGVDGVSIGLLTAGAGPALLLVHGGMGSRERWEPVWGPLTRRWRVTAMDRRGRGSSGDDEAYSLMKEYADVTAAANYLAEAGDPVDVFGYSYGATCTVGAAAGGAPFRRIALYEPPGPETVSAEWLARVTAWIAEGNPGRAMFSFLTEIVGLTPTQFAELRAAPGAEDVLPIASATMAREARALQNVSLDKLAGSIVVPVLLLLGSSSPSWAEDNTRALAARLPDAKLAILAGHGHDAVDLAPDLVVSTLEDFFDRRG